MPALTSIALALGAASLGAGIYEKVQGDQKAQQGLDLQQQGYATQATAARQLHDISVNQAASSVQFAGQQYNLNAQDVANQLSASQQSNAINKNIYNDQLAVQQQRRQAMELDAQRSQLQALRTAQQARSMALFNAQNSGSQRGSGLQGGYGQISGQTNTNMLGTQQNLQTGENIFNLNADISKNNLASNDLQYLLATQRAATQTAQANLQFQYATTNAGYQTQTADAQSIMAQGQGYVNQGSGIVGSGQMQSQFGSTLINAAPTIFSTGVTASNVFAGTSMSNWGTQGTSTFNPFNYTGSLY